VLVSKYADHPPLYRQSQIYARQEIELDRSTLADWVGRAAAELATWTVLVRGLGPAGEPESVHGQAVEEREPVAGEQEQAWARSRWRLPCA
jgi:hypothetical protein